MDKTHFIKIAIALLKEGKTTEIPAYGISMFPILLPGDLLIISPDNNYKRGDIVVFEGKETLVAHRIVKIDNSTIICKGDSLVIKDAPLNSKAILGKIVGRKRKGHLISSKHWTFNLAKRVMPYLGKYPSMLIRFSALVYLKMSGGR